MIIVMGMARPLIMEFLGGPSVIREDLTGGKQVLGLSAMSQGNMNRLTDGIGAVVI